MKILSVPLTGRANCTYYLGEGTITYILKDDASIAQKYLPAVIWSLKIVSVEG